MKSTEGQLDAELPARKRREGKKAKRRSGRALVVMSFGVLDESGTDKHRYIITPSAPSTANMNSESERAACAERTRKEQLHGGQCECE